MPRRYNSVYWVLLGLSIATTTADAAVNVILQGQVAPGVYGRVEIGNAPPPPVVYVEPVTIVRPAAPVQSATPPVQPIYLHVPPGHAKHWKKHCKKYDACGQPVYFVKSAEYEPKEKKKKKDQ